MYFEVTNLHENSRIEIYNIKGQKVNQLNRYLLSAGQHSVVWNGRDENSNPVSSGIYFYKLKVNGKDKSVRKYLLLK
ncbi:MAG: gliding motility-associated C-terminal domain-containing protein [Armatimonadetes bacterium]|nr:gliding motility-associated C-terminal domain-containing protein [Armatimonadota bacterium]